MSERTIELVIAASGLSSVFARGAIMRACERANVVAELMTSTDLKRALPEIERALRVFLTGEDLAKRMAEVALLAR
jgi:hypothetical protein